MDSLYGKGQYNEEGTATSLRCFDATNSSNQGATSPSIVAGTFEAHELQLLACISQYCSQSSHSRHGITQFTRLIRLTQLTATGLIQLIQLTQLTRITELIQLTQITQLTRLTQPAG